jgi:hypothetical protein
MSRKRIRSSDDEGLYTLISNPVDIHRKTSAWNEHDQSSLRIYFENARDENDIVTQVDKLDNLFANLTLSGWDRDRFLRTTYNEYSKIQDKRAVTIMKKISSIVKLENANAIKVDTFMLSLLTYLDFDSDPLSMHAQYEYMVELSSECRITSIVEYMITKSSDNGDHVILFIEDKHKKNVSDLRDWEEPQIAGEIFSSAHHNAVTAGDVHYPFDIFAVRVVGTIFTFYKTTVYKEYLKECQSGGLPMHNKMVIKRYPQGANPYNNHWDFCDEQDRNKILRMMQSIESFSKHDF